MRVRRHLLHPAFGLLASLLTISSLRAATLTVNSTADDAIAGNGRVTLREAVIAAENNTATDLGQTGGATDTISMTGVNGTITLATPLPAIASTITFTGPSALTLTITGGGAQPFLTLSAAANVTLNNLLINNCFRAANGGAISVLGSLTASNCRFTNNHSKVTNAFDAMGSAIYGGSAGSSIDLANCTFMDNVAELNTNNFFFFVGSAAGTIGSLQADNCLFQHNSTLMTGTPTGGGGMGHSLGVYSGGSIQISNCTIRDGYFTQPADPSNYSTWASVYVGGVGCQFTANNCTWTGNVGYPAVGVYTISNSTTTNTLTMSNCTFANNGDFKAGSMILCFGGSAINMTLEHCTIADNQSSGNFYPASIYASVGGPTPKLSLINTVLANYDKSENRAEMSNGFPFISNGFNFVANLGGAVPSQTVKTYANTSVTRVRELLNTLADNGAAIQTCSLPNGSLLIDSANPSGFAATDERAVARPRDGDGVGGSQPDIGAYERFNSDLSVSKTVNRSQAANGASLSYVLTVTNLHASETARSVVVTDILPPNLVFVNFTGSNFNSAIHSNGVITAKRTTLAPGGSAQVTVNCTVTPFSMINTISAEQLGYEVNPANNSASVSTQLITPPSPRVIFFAASSANPTSLSQALFRLAFDRDVTGLDATDLGLVGSGVTGTFGPISPVGSGALYDVTVNGISTSGTLGLLLADNDSIKSVDGEPLGGAGSTAGTSSSLVVVDKGAPQSGPVAAAGTLGPPALSVFHLLYKASDGLSGVRGVDVFFRKGTSGAFTKLAGGPFTQGFVPFDTAMHGGNGTYEFYIVAIDRAGNVESKAANPEIGVVFGDLPPQTGVLSWQLY